MGLNVELFLQTLPLMGKGMLGITRDLVLIILAIVALNKATAPKDSDKK